MGRAICAPLGGPRVPRVALQSQVKGVWVCGTTLFSELAHELPRTRRYLVFDMEGRLGIGIRGVLHRICDMAVTWTQHCNEADVSAAEKL